ncbi:MAG: threonine synthase, partial [Clostridia bacterium]|nr:threonine synthase [Clostridia bacterium]
MTASQAILRGLAPDGGLYVPAMFPQVSPEKIVSLSQLPYARRASEILRLFLEDFSPAEIEAAVSAAYGGDRFDDP